ncbi:CAAX prenyl protease-like protein [Halopolyspora algeriensis]|uniref:CAAX prenyl protease-like protein n=1 Tax=Halopolyspora algeriensis TaxID=1500506 RepID=A0A368W047_9ACTN|nr:CPBP family intramembrane glutamic endopeptidase [Halopolyspora algeriensis]RCW45284.1 CAAX prenyl protease-like protein [Halopolyspora algeriensis]TQM47324.1 CAAX prenyl protease-like protein [Halopolyspora algeriensis]
MDTEYDRVDVRGVVGFVLLAYLPAWLLTLPMWLTGQGLSWVWSPVVLVAMMFMPAVATFVTNRWISPRRRMLRETGITGPGGIRAWWRYALIGWFGPPLAMMLALLVGHAFGVYRADWGDFSGLAEQVRFSLIDNPDVPTGTAVVILAAHTFLLGWLNVIPAFGEEWGWRGYLTRALLPLGQPGAFLVTGVLWGLWHAPLLVLGYNYPTVPVVVSFFMMICFCTLVGTLLGWLRLASHSVWPAVIGHGFLNASATLPVVFSAPGQPVANASVGLLGWSGWIVLVLLILVLIALHRLPVPNPVPREPGLTRGVRRLNRR